MQAEEAAHGEQKCSPLPSLVPAAPPPPPLGEVATHGANCGVRWRRLPRLTEVQLRERLLREEEEGGGEGGGREEERQGASGGGGGGGRRPESVPLHVRLEGRLVPTLSAGASSASASASAAAAAARLDRAHAAVVDDFVSEEARAQLLSLVVFGPPSGGEEGCGGGGQEEEEAGGDEEEEDGGQNRRRIYDELSGSAGLPRPRWERRTADSAEDAEDEEDGSGRRRLGWGLSSAAIDGLLRLASPSSSSPASSPPPPRALAEVGSKLCAMFPEHDCLWLPTESMEGGGGRFDQDDGEDGDGEEPSSSAPLFSTSPPLLANAASSHDAFSYHVDCDPDSSPSPESPWHRAYGHYANGEPNSPLLVSLVLYLNESWRPAFAGETLVMDSTAAVGCAVLPRPRRALLLESDVLHKVCPPSSGSGSNSSAGNRLRFSLVFKLALCPKRRASFSSLSSSNNNVNVLSRDWWGPPADLGSAKALSELVRRVGEEKKKRKRGGGGGEGKAEKEEGGSGGG